MTASGECRVPRSTPYRRPPYFLLCGLVVAAFLLAQPLNAQRYDVEFLGPVLGDSLLQHGKEIYILSGCAYCHGLDLVPDEEAADLMHSPMVGLDENGNLIGPLLRAGIPVTRKTSPMPQFSDLSDEQIAAMARWIHYARQRGRYKELTEATNTVGNATLGQAYFDKECTACHSSKREFARLASTYDAVTLRARMLDPEGLKAEASFKLDELRDAKAAARQRHQKLLENYSAEDVANLMTYLRRSAAPGR